MTTLQVIKHFLTFFFVLIPLQIAGILILPFILPFIHKDREYLPKSVRWFDNHEIYFKNKDLDGLAGPDYYREPRGIYPFGPHKYWKLLYYRYTWLAFRNPVNYFQYKVLGQPLEGEMVLEETGTYEIDARYGQYGTHRATLKDFDGKVLAWEYYTVQPLFWRFSLRFRMGWKIGKIDRAEVGEVFQWVLSPGIRIVQDK